jgi:alpha-beta hydrolase superfamily lysophospholipase
MISDSLLSFKDFLHAQLCYQVLITPMHFPIEKQYRNFAKLAREYLQRERTELIHHHHPRHHVLHHFAQNNPQAKKILIAHGWMSRAAYMSRLIRALHRQGFDVYALDFPAHGESSGLQLTWLDAVSILKSTMDRLGPFYAVIGHSFGGSMILNSLNLSSQHPKWHIEHEPERVILLASPTRMRTPVSRIARQLGITPKGYQWLRHIFQRDAEVDLKRLDFHKYIRRATIPFLCVHGLEDTAIHPDDSIVFCKCYPHATLNLLAGANHVSLLVDERVEQSVCEFLT